MIAVTASPGTANVSIGISAPPIHALLEDSLATIPSTAPSPKGTSGFFTRRFASLYATVGSVSTKNYAKGLISVMIGLVISMIGLDPLMGTKRLTFGIQNLAGGVSTVPALVGFFGFAEVLSVVYNMKQEQNVLTVKAQSTR